MLSWLLIVVLLEGDKHKALGLAELIVSIGARQTSRRADECHSYSKASLNTDSLISPNPPYHRRPVIVSQSQAGLH